MASPSYSGIHSEMGVHVCYEFIANRNSIVSTVTWLQAGQWPLWFSAETGDFSLFQNIQTSSEAHPASCSMGTGGSFMEVERLGHAATYLHVLLTLGMSIAIPLLLLYMFMASARIFFLTIHYLKRYSLYILHCHHVYNRCLTTDVSQTIFHYVYVDCLHTRFCTSRFNSLLVCELTTLMTAGNSCTLYPHGEHV